MRLHFLPVTQRLALSLTSKSESAKFPSEFRNSLNKIFESLILALEKKDRIEIWGSLENLSVLTYANSGNGFYLFIREKLKIV